MIQAIKFISTPMLLMTIICLIAMPEAINTATVQSIDIFIHIILPAIFPFMLFSKLLSSTKAGHFLSRPLEPICKYILGIPKELAPVVLSSLTGGYLASTSSLIQFQNDGKLDTDSISKYIKFLILPAPSIAISAVGFVVFGSYELGILIFLSQIIACIELRWIIFPKNISTTIKSRKNSDYLSFSSALPLAVSDSAKALPTMLASVFTANIFLNILHNLKILNLIEILISKLGFGIMNKSEISLISNGFVEVCIALSSGNNISFSYVSLIIMTFLISFAGISVILQILSLASSQGIFIKGLISSRILHAVLTCINLLPVIFVYNKTIPAMQVNSAVLIYSKGMFFESMSMLGLTAMMVCLAGRICSKISEKST